VRNPGLDVGTTSVSAVLLEAEAARLVAARTVPHGAARAGEVAGRAELDLDVLWRMALETLAEVAADAEGGDIVGALGVTGQMHGLAFVRPDGTPVGRAITWQDQRATERDETGATYLEQFVTAAGGPAAFHDTGALPATGYLGPSLYWLHRRGNPPSPPVTACGIPDAIVARLTGGPAVTDPTNAASTGLYNVAGARWAYDLVDLLGIPPVLLTPVRPSGVVAGGLRGDLARILGLPGGLPVAVAIGDNQASFIGSVRDVESSLLVNIGTGAQVSALVGAFARGPGFEVRPFPGGRYLLVGAGLYGGASYALLRDLYRQVGADLFGAQRDEELYERMNALAARVPPGSDGLCCLPSFSGTRVDPAIRGSFTGVSAHNLTPGHLARAVLEGVSNQLYALYEAMRPLTGPRADLVGAGNAIAQNGLLAHILASRFSLPLHLPAFDEAAAVGAALVAATAVGAYPSIDEAMANTLRYRATVDPGA